MKILPDKVYDILKQICQIVMPALITFVGVVMVEINSPYTEVTLVIMTAFNTFLGSCLGISSAVYNQYNDEGEQNDEV